MKIFVLQSGKTTTIYGDRRRAIRAGERDAKQYERMLDAVRAGQTIPVHMPTDPRPAIEEIEVEGTTRTLFLVALTLLNAGVRLDEKLSFSGGVKITREQSWEYQRESEACNH